jgi:hypothetical protein
MTDRELIAEWLYQGAVALSQGKRELAQQYLLKVVQADEGNEEGWLWLSGAVDEIEDQETALLNVLDINPNNPHAQKGLAMIRAHKSS